MKRKNEAKAMFGSHKVLKKEKKILKEMVFSYLILLWKISMKLKYN